MARRQTSTSVLRKVEKNEWDTLTGLLVSIQKYLGTYTAVSQGGSKKVEVIDEEAITQLLFCC